MIAIAKPMLTLADMKRCPRCKCHVDRALFWRDTTRPDGLHSYCKPCHKMYEAARPRRKNIDWSLADWTMGDTDVARMVGCTRQAVHRHRILHGIQQVRDRAYIAPERIVDQVCRLAHVSTAAMCNGDMTTEARRTRIVVAGLCREMSGCSYPDIAARAFGARSHSSTYRRCKWWNLLDARTRDGWRFRVSTALRYWHSPDGLSGELAAKAREELAVQR